MVLDLRDQMHDAEVSLLDFAVYLCESDRLFEVGMGEGMALAAMEIRRILSLEEATR